MAHAGSYRHKARRRPRKHQHHASGSYHDRDDTSSTSDDGPSSSSSSTVKDDCEANPSNEIEHSTPEGRAKGVATNNLLWPPDKDCLKVRFLNGWTGYKKLVENTVKKNFHTIPMRLRFKFLEKGASGPSDIRITFGKSSASYVGRKAEIEGRCKGATMWLAEYCDIIDRDERKLTRQAAILHEFGHALGMEHEHQHPDFKPEWNYRVLQAKNGWDAETVRFNYQMLGRRGVKLAPYDPKSIMHYPIFPGDTYNDVACVYGSTALSDGDKKFLMSVYPIKRTPRSTSVREWRLKPKTPKKSRTGIAVKIGRRPGPSPDEESTSQNPTTIISGGGYFVFTAGPDVVLNVGAHGERHGGGVVMVYVGRKNKAVDSVDARPRKRPRMY